MSLGFVKLTTFNGHSSEQYCGNDRALVEVEGFAGRNKREYALRPSDAKYGAEYAKNMRQAAANKRKVVVKMPKTPWE